MIELETLLLIQAEAFLSARGAVDMSEGRRNALNALLYQTGQQSYNFMMVLATNRPQDLDSAVRPESSSLNIRDDGEKAHATNGTWSLKPGHLSQV